MPALPTSVSFTDSGVTEAQFKTAITNQREFLAGLLGTSGDVPDALTALGTLGSSTLTKSSAYTVVGADRGALIECTGTFTLSLTAAATLAEGFVFAVFNKGTGIITIDPASTEQINGASTLAIAAGSWGIISCTGTAFNSLGSVPATGALIGYQIFTSSGTYSKSTNNPSFVIVEVVGGGGTGGSSGTVANGNTSSFGSHCSATGGASGSNNTGGAGGSGSGGDLNLTGGGGTVGDGITSIGAGGGAGGNSVYGGGARGAPYNNRFAGAPNTGGGGQGGAYSLGKSTVPAAGGGAGGYSKKKILASSLASSETVTVGAGGNGSTTSGSGGSGIVIVWEYK
jgi:hypothetical protein